jgi:hypothetical protein
MHDIHLVRMHAIGALEGVTLLEFEGLNQEEHPPMEEQEVQAPEGGVNDKELLECSNHQPSSFLKGKPRSILSFLHFFKIQFEYFMMLDALSYRSSLKTLVAYIFSPCPVNISCILSQSRIEYLLSHA